MKVYIAENLQYLMDRERLNQSELADKIGVSQSNVNYWLKGKGYPKLEMIITICELFNVAVGDFITHLIDANTAREDAAIYATAIDETTAQQIAIAIVQNEAVFWNNKTFNLFFERKVMQEVNKELKMLLKKQEKN
jgi:transcriptional regulator with XRE-family HTH domain